MDYYIDMEKFAVGKIKARRYRNSKIGEFIKKFDKRNGALVWSKRMIGD